MCGIAGILHLQNKETASGDAIRAMAHAMEHRGPDAEGIFADGNMYLGHRRLSIIDLSERSNQPMFDPERRYAIVFNGEVYNYQEVRSRLKQYPFKTGGDTEVVLAAFREWGWNCLEQLKGMFAFAIWDCRENRLYLARDRMGVKPLYYYRDEQVFVFASEIRSILSSGLVKRKISLPAIVDYMQYQSFQCPQTIIEDVWELKAGHYMEIGAGYFKTEAYWSILNAPVHEHFSAAEARLKLKELLLQSVARRMVADVPVAAFLSGGIDSTAVVALMAELAASVETFNVSFKDTEFDESKYAQMVSAKFGTRHHTIITSPEKFLDEFPNALLAMDSPSGDGINTYIVAKAVRSMGIKVALSGIGADELFAGYPIFHHWMKIRKNSIFWKLPYGLRKTLSNLAVGNNIRNQRISGLLRMQTPSIENVYTLLRQVNSKQSIHRLMKQLPQHSQLSDNLREMQPRIGQFPLLSQLSIAEFSGYTRQTLLRDTDQMSMSQSLEVREPFFDHELVEYVLGLPDGLKSGDRPKPLLLDTLGSSIPREIYDRPKKGFVLPFENWFRNELRSFCEVKINDLSQRGFFKEKELHNYWDDFLHQRNTVRWTNIMLLISLEHYLHAHGLEV